MKLLRAWIPCWRQPGCRRQSSGLTLWKRFFIFYYWYKLLNEDCPIASRFSKERCLDLNFETDSKEQLNSLLKKFYGCVRTVALLIAIILASVAAAIRPHSQSWREHLCESVVHWECNARLDAVLKANERDGKDTQKVQHEESFSLILQNASASRYMHWQLYFEDVLETQDTWKLQE